MTQQRRSARACSPVFLAVLAMPARAACQHAPDSADPQSKPQSSLAGPLDDEDVTATQVDANPVSKPTYHCFSWVHGPEHSQDCYPSRAKCEQEREAMHAGARPTTPGCARVDYVSCVSLSLPPETAQIERCFGDGAACDRYRDFVMGTGHRVTSCELR